MSDLYIDDLDSFVEHVVVEPGSLLDTGKPTAAVFDLAAYRRAHGQEAANLMLAVKRRQWRLNPPKDLPDPDDVPGAFTARTDEIELESKFDEAAPAAGPPVGSIAYYLPAYQPIAPTGGA